MNRQITELKATLKDKEIKLIMKDKEFENEMDKFSLISKDKDIDISFKQYQIQSKDKDIEALQFQIQLTFILSKNVNRSIKNPESGENVIRFHSNVSELNCPIFYGKTSLYVSGSLICNVPVVYPL